MSVAVVALIVWCLILTFVVYGQSEAIETLEARGKLDLELHRGQQDINDQIDRDITRLEDRSREVTR